MYCICLGKRIDVIENIRKKGLKVIVVVDKSLPPPPKKLCDKLILVNNICDFDEVNKVLEKYFNSYNISTIISPGELGVITAAKLREKYKIPGIGLDLANILRNKYKMKNYISKFGILVANYKKINSYNDGLSFLNLLFSKNSYAVAKPILGQGSTYIKIIKSEKDFKEYYNYYLENSTSKSFNEGFLLEKYIAGEEFHIDTIVYKKNIVFSIPSIYTSKPHDFSKSNTVFGSIILDAKDKFYNQLLEFNNRIISILGIEYGVTHLEGFISNNNKIVFGEIAIRPGGSGIAGNIFQHTNVDIIKAFVNVECQDEYKFNPVEINDYSGFLSIPIRNVGEIIKFNEFKLLENNLTKVSKINYIKNIGDIVKVSNSSADRIGDIFLKGSSIDDIYGQMNYINKQSLYDVK